MSEFDRYTERCMECDGHWRHYHPCSYLNCPAVYVDGRFQGLKCDAPGNSPHPTADDIAADEADAAIEAEADARLAQYDNDPNPYEGTYSED